MTEFKFCRDDFFHPWIGRNFASPANLFEGKRVLIVGESHYGEGEQVGTCDPCLTSSVIYNHKTWKKPTKVFRHGSLTKAAGVLRTGLGKCDEASVDDVWDNCAFYNYLPVFVAKGPRLAKIKGVWDLGCDQFQYVLSVLRPDLIFVFGLGLYYRSYSRHCRDQVPDSLEAGILTETIANGHSVPTAVLPHFSWGMSYKRCEPAIRAAFDQAVQ